MRGGGQTAGKRLLIQSVSTAKPGGGGERCPLPVFKQETPWLQTALEWSCMQTDTAKYIPGCSHGAKLPPPYPLRPLRPGQICR